MAPEWEHKKNLKPPKPGSGVATKLPGAMVEPFPVLTLTIFDVPANATAHHRRTGDRLFVAGAKSRFPRLHVEPGDATRHGGGRSGSRPSRELPRR